MKQLLHYHHTELHIFMIVHSFLPCIDWMDLLILGHRSVGQFHINLICLHPKKNGKKKPLPEYSPYTACSTYVCVWADLRVWAVLPDYIKSNQGPCNCKLAERRTNEDHLHVQLKCTKHHAAFYLHTRFPFSQAVNVAFTAYNFVSVLWTTHIVLLS